MVSQHRNRLIAVQRTGRLKNKLLLLTIMIRLIRRVNVAQLRRFIINHGQLRVDDLCGGESGLLLGLRQLIDKHLIGIQIGFVEALDSVLAESKVA